MIPLTGPDDADVPRQGNRVFLQENGHVIIPLPLMKEWSDFELDIKICEAFQDIIHKQIDFELLQSVHTKLLKPTLAPGQYLTGALVHRIFRDKPVYVHPNQQILKPLKQRKHADDQDDNDFEATNGTWPIASTGATGEKQLLRGIFHRHQPTGYSDINAKSSDNIPSLHQQLLTF